MVGVNVLLLSNSTSEVFVSESCKPVRLFWLVKGVTCC
jgi:hypothetical protein